MQDRNPYIYFRLYAIRDRLSNKARVAETAFPRLPGQEIYPCLLTAGRLPCIKAGRLQKSLEKIFGFINIRNLGSNRWWWIGPVMILHV